MLSAKDEQALRTIVGYLDSDPHLWLRHAWRLVALIRKLQRQQHNTAAAFVAYDELAGTRAADLEERKRKRASQRLTRGADGGSTYTDHN